MSETSRMRIGGLYRCCTGTIDLDKGPDEEGRVLPCLYCSSSVIFRDGAWEWYREPEEPKP